MSTEKESFYELLGVGKDATDEEIKAAYRREARKHHPDVGGDTDRMARLTVAYACLISSEQRAHYDATGRNDPSELQRTQGAREVLLATFGQILVNNIEQDCLGFARRMINQRLSTIRNNKERSLKAKEVFEARRKRFKVKKGQSNLFHLLIDQHLRKLEDGMGELEKDEEKHLLALEMLKAYSVDETVPGDFRALIGKLPPPPFLHNS